MEIDIRMIVEGCIVIAAIYARYEILKSHTEITKDVANGMAEHTAIITATLKRMEDLQIAENDKLEESIKQVAKDSVSEKVFEEFKKGSYKELIKRVDKLDVA